MDFDLKTGEKFSCIAFHNPPIDNSLSEPLSLGDGLWSVFWGQALQSCHSYKPLDLYHGIDKVRKSFRLWLRNRRGSGFYILTIYGKKSNLRSLLFLFLVY